MKLQSLILLLGASAAIGAPKQETATLLKQQPLKAGAATQGLAIGKQFFYGANATTLCRFDKKWKLIEQKTITVKGVNHLGAIHYRDGFLWGGFLNHAVVDGKSDPTQNRSIIAKIRAKDFTVIQTWDITKDVKWIDPVCFDGTHLWVGDLSDLGLHRYRFAEDKLTRDGVLRYPKPMHFSQGIRVVGSKLYTIHTFGNMDGLFEFKLPEKLGTGVHQPTRVWAIAENRMHLEGFDFAPGKPNQIWHSQGNQVDRYQLSGIGSARTTNP